MKDGGDKSGARNPKFQTMLKKISKSLGRKVMARLETPQTRYVQRIYNNMDKLYRIIQKGDLVLVEGRSEMSRIIKLFSQSHWSHVAFYVGDELIKPGEPNRSQYTARFGDEAKHLIIEAFQESGVVAAPMSKYQDYNIRICRPYGILPEDLKAVVAHVKENLGKQYDRQNIIDIAWMLISSSLNPFKKHPSIKRCLGACSDYNVICSGMIAQAFQRVGYPIVPAFYEPGRLKTDFKNSPYGARLVMRHYSQILPRDFDLSPNFEIVKFNIIKNGAFEYKSLWADREAGDSENGAKG